MQAKGTSSSFFPFVYFLPPPFFAPVTQAKAEEFPLLFPFSSFLENEKTLGTRLRAREGNVESWKWLTYLPPPPPEKINKTRKKQQQQQQQQQNTSLASEVRSWKLINKVFSCACFLLCSTLTCSEAPWGRKVGYKKSKKKRKKCGYLYASNKFWFWQSLTSTPSCKPRWNFAFQAAACLAVNLIATWTFRE